MNNYQSNQQNKTEILTEKYLDKILIVECGEKLYDIEQFVGTKIMMSPARREYQGEDKLYARKSVCMMLSEVNKKLPTNYSLVLFDAHRPVEYQQKRYESLYSKIQNENPGLGPEELRAKTYTFIFPPSMDLKTPPPHSTGGAIDLTLMDGDGKLLDMGTQYGEFGEKTYTYADNITTAQKSNRQKLLDLMSPVGFANYPGEWWHFMYGDREWAAYKNMPNAIYTRIDAKNVGDRNEQL